jgi:PAS domain S-box-containing protein
LQGIEAGADDFISKPINKIEIRKRVETIIRLDRYRQMRAAELQAERDRTRAILEAVGEAVVVTDVAGIIQYMNAAAVELTGYTPAQAIGQGWWLWHSDQQSDDFYADIHTYVQAGNVWRGEVVNRRKDGTLYNAMKTIAPLFDPQNREEVVGLVSVQRDITPLKEADRMKDQFVSNVSHELRTPLSVLTLLSGSLEKMYASMDEATRYVMIQDIRNQTRLLNDLVSDILDMSRIDSQRVSMQRDPLDLAQLLREEVEKQLPLMQRKHQEAHVLSDKPVLVHANDGQLRQVIRNLVNNAIKYTPEYGNLWCECVIQGSGVGGQGSGVGGRKNTQSFAEKQGKETEAQEMASDTTPDPHAPPHHFLHAWPGVEELAEGEWAAIRIIDTGIGIALEELPKLFERFYRVTPQGSVPGTGLGLSIARDLIRLHNGHIAIHSTPGAGTVIAFYLPALQ